MTRFVLDASVTLRWLLDQPVPAFAERVKGFILSGSRAVVPALWHLEIANALAIAERRRILTVAELEECLDEFQELVDHSVDTHLALISTRQVLNVARSFRITAYDGAYLHLAIREQLPLATLDDKLRGAASQAGVTLVH